MAGMWRRIKRRISLSRDTKVEKNSENGNSTAVDVDPKKNICCACPDTKQLRDECVVEHGEAACTKWIEAHKRCLRAVGFNV